MTGAGATRAVTCTVRVSAPDVTRFRAGIGATDAARWPTTLPIIWLSHPDVIAAVRDLAADRPSALPVHEAQTIETMAAPPLDAPLSVHVDLCRSDADRITVDTRVSDGAGRALVRLHTILRLVP